MRTAMVAGGAAAVAHHAGRRSAEAQAQEDAQNQQIANLQQQQYASPAPTAAPATGPTQDNIQKLKELGELHAQGILTDEEFAAQKAKLL
jgi:hypothetical protein